MRSRAALSRLHAQGSLAHSIVLRVDQLAHGVSGIAAPLTATERAARRRRVCAVRVDLPASAIAPIAGVEDRRIAGPGVGERHSALVTAVIGIIVAVITGLSDVEHPIAAGPLDGLKRATVITAVSILEIPIIARLFGRLIEETIAADLDSRAVRSATIAGHRVPIVADLTAHHDPVAADRDADVALHHEVRVALTRGLAVDHSAAPVLPAVQEDGVAVICGLRAIIASGSLIAAKSGVDGHHIPSARVSCARVIRDRISRGVAHIEGRR